jgi:hypothetical protein
VPLTVKFIGALRHISGKTQFAITFQEGISIKELVGKICQELPELAIKYSTIQGQTR